MKISRKQLRKIIKESLLLEAQEGIQTRTYVDQSGYRFSVQSDEKIFYIGNGDKDLEQPKEMTGSQKVKVAKNLIRDEKAAGSRVSDSSILSRIANPKAAESEEGTEVIKDGGYTFKLFSDGRFLVVSRGDKKINKELTGDAKQKSVKNIQFSNP